MPAVRNRYIVSPDRGVRRDVPEYEIDEREWSESNWVRMGHGKVEIIPGYTQYHGGATMSGDISLAAQFRLSNGIDVLIVGDKDDLYRYSAKNKTVTSISASLAAFGRGIDTPWAYAIFQDTFYITSPGVKLHKYTGSGDFVAVGGDSFASRCIGAMFNFLVAAGEDNDELAFRWAKEGSDTTWIAASSNDAGTIDLAEFGDIPQRFMRLGTFGVLYGQNVTHRMAFVGGAAVFAKQVSLQGLGVFGPYGAADLGDSHFVISNDGFYIFDGFTPRSVGEKVWHNFIGDADMALLRRCRCAYAHELGLVFIFYVSTTSADKRPDKFYTYDRKTDLFYGPSTLVDPVVMADRWIGQLGLAIDEISDIINDVTDPIDSAVGTIAPPYIVIGSKNGKLFGVESGVVNAAGTAITRKVISGDHYIGKPQSDILGGQREAPNKYFQINRFYYEVGDDKTSGDITVKLSVRSHTNETVTYQKTATITQGTSDSSKGKVDWISPVGRWLRVEFSSTIDFNVIAYGWDYVEKGTRSP